MNIKGKCPYCGGIVFKFDGCYICQKCLLVWSRGLKEWERDNPNLCICIEPIAYLKDYKDNIFCGRCGKIIKNAK